MRCDLSTKPRMDLSKSIHPRAVHSEAFRFIRGIRGPRQNAVSRKEIGKWLFATPAESVDTALLDLIAEGKITAGPLSLRYRGNTHKRATGYWVAQHHDMAMKDGEGWLRSYKDTGDLESLRMAVYWLSEALRFARDAKPAS